MPCLTEDAVEEFVSGEMAPGAASAVERHMAECEACRGWVADVAKVAFDDDVPEARSPAVGDVVGRYRLVEVLGVGGMGVVFAAEDPELARRVALKLIRTDLADASGSELTSRLHREARAMAKISHPNVVTVHDIGTIGDHLFVAMEYVHGSTLRGWCAAKPRHWAEILDVFLAAGRGLVAAHAVGLVHRDFKPENVLCGDDGRVRVTDFGLARGDLQTSDRWPAAPTPRSTGPLEGTPSLATRTGQLVGTPAYMAPEQLSGTPADARSDQFSFAVALFEALYGTRPYPANDLRELTVKLAVGRVVPPPAKTEVPVSAHAILARALRPDPEERHASVEALLDELARLKPKVSLRPGAPRRRFSVFALAALAIALGGIAATRAVKPRAAAGAATPCGVEKDGKLHCGNTPNVAVHAQPRLSSAFVNGLRTTTSWFDCWVVGESDPRGGTTWYHTVGDDNARWGFVPAADIGTTPAFNVDPSARGLKKCEFTPPEPLPKTCELRADGRLHCVNNAGAALYLSPNTSSRVVNHLRSTASWFKCYGMGQAHSGGNSTWYFTLGDDNANWGWIPASELSAPRAFNEDPDVYGFVPCN